MFFRLVNASLRGLVWPDENYFRKTVIFFHLPLALIQSLLIIVRLPAEQRAF